MVLLGYFVHTKVLTVRCGQTCFFSQRLQFETLYKLSVYRPEYAKILNINEDFAEWYQYVTIKAELADYGPVKGTMISQTVRVSVLWKQVQRVLGNTIRGRRRGCGFSVVILFSSENEEKKEHVEGFAPEVAMITEAGGEKLEEPLVIRPTSETIMYKTFQTGSTLLIRFTITNQSVVQYCPLGQKSSSYG